MTDTTTTAVPDERREELALDLVDWWHAYGSDAAWEVTGERLPGDLLDAACAFVDHAVAILGADLHVGWIVAEQVDGELVAHAAVIHEDIKQAGSDLGDLAHYGTYTVYRLSAVTVSEEDDDVLVTAVARAMRRRRLIVAAMGAVADGALYEKDWQDLIAPEARAELLAEARVALRAAREGS